MTKPPQARNAMKRALADAAGLKFTAAYKERCKSHFKNCCAYCENSIAPNSRRGHFDHSVAICMGATSLHLVYACYKCNGDNKREKPWESFLEEVCKEDPQGFLNRKNRILDWFKSEPPVEVAPIVLEALQRAQLEAIRAFNEEVENLRRLSMETNPVPDEDHRRNLLHSISRDLSMRVNES